MNQHLFKFVICLLLTITLIFGPVSSVLAKNTSQVSSKSFENMSDEECLAFIRSQDNVTEMNGLGAAHPCSVILI